MVTHAKNANKNMLSLQRSVVAITFIDTCSTEITQYKLIMFSGIQNSACFGEWIKLINYNKCTTQDVSTRQSYNLHNTNMHILQYLRLMGLVNNNVYLCKYMHMCVQSN